MNIHLPAILMWTEGVQGFDTLPCQYCWAKIIQLQSVFPRSGRLSELFQPFPQWCRTRRRFKISYSMILSIALVVVATLALLVAGHWTSLHLQNTGQNTWFMSLWLMLIMLAQPHAIAIILQSYCHHIAIHQSLYSHPIPGDPTKPWIPLSPGGPRLDGNAIIRWNSWECWGQDAAWNEKLGIEWWSHVVATSESGVICTFKMVCHCL